MFPGVRKGQRTRSPSLCACGCGASAPIIYRVSGPRAGHVKRYAHFIPGHGYKDWGRRQKLRPAGAGDYRPLGSTQLHYASPRLVYRKIKVGPGQKGWRFEHRVIMEQHLGRPLDRNEIVHHKNENTLDNRVENLAVMMPADHSRHHGTLHRWAKNFDQCQQCGTTERYHYGKGLCSRCWQRVRAARRGRWR
jgi:hypothetical protein